MRRRLDRELTQFLAHLEGVNWCGGKASGLLQRKLRRAAAPFSSWLRPAQGLHPLSACPENKAHESRGSFLESLACCRVQPDRPVALAGKVRPIAPHLGPVQGQPLRAMMISSPHC